MNLIVLSIFTYIATAQITFATDLNSSNNIYSVPGCYPIQPSISEVKGVEGYKLKFYNHYNCKGRKVEEITGDSVFKSPVYAISVEVVKILQNSNQPNGLGTEKAIKYNNIDSLNHGKKFGLFDKENVNTYESENFSLIGINYSKFDGFKSSSKRLINAELLNKETSGLEYCEEGYEMNGEECILANNDSYSNEYKDTNDWRNTGPDFEDRAFDISNRPIEYDTELVDNSSYIYHFLKHFF